MNDVKAFDFSLTTDPRDLVRWAEENRPVPAGVYVEMFKDVLKIADAEKRKELASALLSQMFYEKNFIATQALHARYEKEYKKYLPHDRLDQLSKMYHPEIEATWHLFEYVPTKDLRTVKHILREHDEFDWRLRGLENETIIHQAAQHGCPEMLRAMIMKGAISGSYYSIDIDAKDKNGHTPLHLAAIEGHPQTLDILIRNGADVNAPGPSGRTILDGIDQVLTKGIIDGKELDEKQRKTYQAVKRRLQKAGATHSRGYQNPLLRALEFEDATWLEQQLKKDVVISSYYYEDFFNKVTDLITPKDGTLSAQEAYKRSAAYPKMAPIMQVALDYAISKGMTDVVDQAGNFLRNKKLPDDLIGITYSAVEQMNTLTHTGEMPAYDERVAKLDEKIARQLHEQKEKEALANQSEVYKSPDKDILAVMDPPPIDPTPGDIRIYDTIENDERNPLGETKQQMMASTTENQSTVGELTGDDGVTLVVQQHVGKDTTRRVYLAKFENGKDAYQHAHDRLSGWQKNRRGRGRVVSGVVLNAKNQEKIKNRILSVLKDQGCSNEEADVLLYKLVQANLLYHPNEFITVDGKRRHAYEVMGVKGEGKKWMNHKNALDLLAGKKELSLTQRAQLAQVLSHVEDAISADGYAILNVKKGQGKNYDTSRLAGYQMGREISDIEQERINNRLFIAMADGDVKEVNHLIAQGGNLNAVRQKEDGSYESPYDVAPMALKEQLKKAGAKPASELKPKEKVQPDVRVAKGEEQQEAFDAQKHLAKNASPIQEGDNAPNMAQGKDRMA